MCPSRWRAEMPPRSATWENRRTSLSCSGKSKGAGGLLSGRRPGQRAQSCGQASSAALKPLGQPAAEAPVALQVPLAAHGCGARSELLHIKQQPLPTACRLGTRSAVVLFKPAVGIERPAHIGQHPPRGRRADDVDITRLLGRNLGWRVQPNFLSPATQVSLTLMVESFSGSVVWGSLSRIVRSASFPASSVPIASSKPR